MMKKNFYLAFIVLAALLFPVNLNGKNGEPVKKELLGNQNGSEVYLFTLTNKSGNVMKLTNYGARIVRVEVPDKNGVRDNITNGAETLELILRGDAFGGAAIGRYANRIANGKFTLDGVEYNLPVNNRPNTLHGGSKGWYTKVWNTEIVKTGAPAVKFTYLSPDMEEGFPGTVNIEVTYTWSDKNEIIMDYAATTDKKTVINVTNHAYFNLHGAGKGYVFDHILTLNASTYTPMDATKIPTGQILPVKGTPFDFTTPHSFGERIGETFDNVVFTGYDHNVVLNPKGKVAAKVYDPVSGRVMEVITDQPALQVYTGSGMGWKKAAGAGGNQPANVRSAFALESQHYPDSPNHPDFPSTVLSPGQKFKTRTIYRFSVQK
jgi:aldose 1-epimerase